MRHTGPGLVLASALLLLCVAAVPAQEAPERNRLRLFLECGACDRDYVRQELEWLDFVRDRQDSDVHVLVTSQGTGTGGREYTLYYIGMNGNEARADTLHYIASPDATQVITRSGLVRKLKIGLMAYVGDLPVADRLNIEVTNAEGSEADTPAQPTRDPWNSWVFSVGGNGYANGESLQQFRNMSLNLNATRTTPAWKIEMSVRGSYSDSEFEVDSVTTITSVRRSYTGTALFARSLGGRVSVGFETGFESSTFGNIELAWRLAPAVEYNFVPYDQWTRRSFTVTYSTGVNAFNYREVTLFDEIEEQRPAHSLRLRYATRQTWGSTSFGGGVSQFLHDTQKYRASIGASASLRLVRGLSVNFGGTFGSIRDQLSIPREDATRDEILLRLRQLETNYFYYFNFGLSYRFGSSIDNVVNPRFDQGIGGGDVFFF